MNAKDMVIIVSLVAALLSGCVATSPKPRDRIGDFVTNIGAAPPATATSRA